MKFEIGEAYTTTGKWRMVVTGRSGHHLNVMLINNLDFRIVNHLRAKGEDAEYSSLAKYRCKVHERKCVEHTTVNRVCTIISDRLNG